MDGGTADFPSAETASRSPLAERLFSVEGVAGVFLGDDFITVTKAEDKEWQVLKPSILGAIMEHYALGGPAVLADEGAATDEGAVTDEGVATKGGGEEDDVVRQIKELIETRVRPAVAQDGGDIVFRSFEAGVVYLQLQGSCSGCPSSTATLKSGIENMLKHYVPEVEEVRAVT